MAAIIQVGSRARKASNGYDLRSLIIGSEGTLAIITKHSPQAAWHSGGDLRRRLPVPER